MSLFCLYLFLIGFVSCVSPDLYRNHMIILDPFTYESFPSMSEHAIVLFSMDKEGIHDQTAEIVNKVNQHFREVPFTMLCVGEYILDEERRGEYNPKERVHYKGRNDELWSVITVVTFEFITQFLELKMAQTKLEVANLLKKYNENDPFAVQIGTVYNISLRLREVGLFKQASEYQKKLTSLFLVKSETVDVNMAIYSSRIDFIDPVSAIFAFDDGYYPYDAKFFHRNQLELYYMNLVRWEDSDLKGHFPLLRSLVEPGDVIVECGVRNMVAVFAFLAGNPKRYVGVDLFFPSFKNYFLASRYASQLNIEFEFKQGNDLELDIPDCDILMIDTLHTYDQLSKELRALSSKSRRYIILHDTSPPWAFKDEPKYQKIRVLENSFEPVPGFIFGCFLYIISDTPSKQGLWTAVVDFLADPLYSNDWSIFRRDTWSYGITVLTRVSRR